MKSSPVSATPTLTARAPSVVSHACGALIRCRFQSRPGKSSPGSGLTLRVRWIDLAACAAAVAPTMRRCGLPLGVRKEHAEQIGLLLGLNQATQAVFGHAHRAAVALSRPFIGPRIHYQQAIGTQVFDHLSARSLDLRAQRIVVGFSLGYDDEALARPLRFGGRYRGD